jgi:hypothetical protein
VSSINSIIAVSLHTPLEVGVCNHTTQNIIRVSRINSRRVCVVDVFYRCCVCCVLYCVIFVSYFFLSSIHNAYTRSPYPIAQFFFLGGIICYIVSHSTISSKKIKKKLNLAIMQKSIEVILYTIFKHAIISTKTPIHCCLPTRWYCNF